MRALWRDLKPLVCPFLSGILFFVCVGFIVVLCFYRAFVFVLVHGVLCTFSVSDQTRIGYWGRIFVRPRSRLLNIEMIVSRSDDHPRLIVQT